MFSLFAPAFARAENVDFNNGGVRVVATWTSGPVGDKTGKTQSTMHLAVMTNKKVATKEVNLSVPPIVDFSMKMGAITHGPVGIDLKPGAKINEYEAAFRFPMAGEYTGQITVTYADGSIESQPFPAPIQVK